MQCAHLIARPPACFSAYLCCSSISHILASLIIACGLHTQSAQELYLRLTGLVATPAHAHASAPASALATAPIHGHQRAAMATPPPAAAGLPSLSKAHPRLPTAVQAH